MPDGAPIEGPERQRTFAEPLAPVGVPGAQETKELAAAIELYRSSRDVEAVAPILEFLERHPRSAWKPSLLANLAVLYRHTGYINRALAAADEAWSQTRQAADPGTKRIADSALASSIELTAALGRTARLVELLAEVRTRPLSGHAAEAVSSGWSGLTIRQAPSAAGHSPSST